MSLKQRALVVFALTCTASSTQAAQLTATAATIQSVFAKAAGGDTIRLTGDFGVTKLNNKAFGSVVTIDASGAHFTDTLLLNNDSNVRVINGSFGSDSKLMTYGKAVAVSGGANITFDNVSATGFYTGIGIAFQGTTNAAVTNSTFAKLHSGVIFGAVNGGSITYSKSVGAVSDGFDIADSRNVAIAHNSCTGGTPTVGAHPDCVQMWSSRGMAQQSNISIHDNYAQGATQGFTSFGSNGIGATNISIVNNRVDGLFSQGIACYQCSASTITGNILTTLDGAPYKVNLNVLGGTGNTVSGNAVGNVNHSLAHANIYYTRDQLIGHASPVVVAAGAVPDASTWSTMLAGFGIVGAVQRRRQQANARIDLYRRRLAI